MELSKKVGYIKGLMAGLDINDSTPEGKVLLAMSDLLEEMADEIETNAEIIDNISVYIDEIEAYDDLLDDLDDDDDLDDIEAEEFDYDPFEELSMAEVTGEDESDDPAGLDDITELELLDGLDDDDDDGVSEEEAAADNSTEQAADEAESFECLCPECGTAFGITAEDIARGTIYCPNCAVQLKFES